MNPFGRTRRPGARGMAPCVVALVALAACSDSVAPEMELGGEGVWEALGEGLTSWPGQTAWSVQSIVGWDGDLVVGGSFLTAGDQPAQRVARWDGSTWHPLGPGLSGPVQALAVHEGTLIAAGAFWLGPQESRIARWDGNEWQPFEEAPQVPGILDRLAVHDGTVFLGGSVQQPLARWNGTAWGPVLVPVDGETLEARPPLRVHRDELVVGIEGNRLAWWDGAEWTVTDAPGLAFGLRSDGHELFASAPGSFHRWNGSTWDVVPTPGQTSAWGVHGGRLVAALTGSEVHHVVQWDGSGWQTLPGGFDGSVDSFGSFGRTLLVGGWFTTIDQEPFRGIAGVVPDWVLAQGGS